MNSYHSIHSYLDDQLKQEIPLKHCRTLTIMQQENIKNVIVSNKDNIYLLEQLSLEEQIDQLLNSYRLQEALILAESNCSLIKQYSTNSLVISTKKRIGLIEFSAMNIIRALNIFNDIHLDFHEVRRLLFSKIKTKKKNVYLDNYTNTKFFTIKFFMAKCR